MTGLSHHFPPPQRTAPDTAPSPAALSAAAEEALLAFIRERTGIALQDHQLPTLRKAIQKGATLGGCSGSDEFLGALMKTPERSPAFDFLLSQITVGESYFYRDPAQMDFLRDQWLPAAIDDKRRQGQRVLRIWSAGCADGQEAHTLAMLLRDVLPDPDDWAIHLLATDINAEALARAARGGYSKWSLRRVPGTLRQRYFERDGVDYMVRPDVRRMVRFAYLNLMSQSYPSAFTDTHSFDLILCRNVFIYFSRTDVGRVLERFADCLVPGGLLMTSPSDPVGMDVPGLAVRNGNGFHFFERAEPQAPSPSFPASLPQACPQPVVPRADDVRSPPPDPSAPRTPAPSSPETRPDARRPAQSAADAGALLAECRWDEALIVTDALLAQDGTDPALLALRARALANLGRLDAARECLERCLAEESLDDDTHMLLGHVLLALNRPGEAEAAFRRALYLRPGRIETHYHLGMLLMGEGDGAGGVRSLRNAQVLAAEADPDSPVPGIPAMTHGQLAEILENDVYIYAGNDGG